MMRKLMMRLTLAVVVLGGALALAAAPALADGGGLFNPGDGRVAPLTADRVAVYLNPTNVDVWGIDSDGIGFHLTTFSLDELTGQKAAVHTTPDGTVTLKLDTPAQMRWVYLNFDATTPSLVTDVSATYHVSWSGGSYGANGSGAFYKTFSATYLK
jgi:hypothetical protein